MPYVNQDARAEVALELQALIATMPKNAGTMNYVISTLIDAVYNPQSYADMNEIIGILESTKLEFYRRVAAPYEDGKLVQNGDVYQQ